MTRPGGGFGRILRIPKHSGTDAARACQSPLLERTNHIGLVWQNLRRTAGREDRYTLAAALEECLELLGILQNN